jgi:hypothetical protein
MINKDSSMSAKKKPASIPEKIRQVLEKLGDALNEWYRKPALQPRPVRPDRPFRQVHPRRKRRERRW